MDIFFIKYLKFPFIPFYIIFFRSFCLINGIHNSPYQKDCLSQQLLFNCWRMFASGKDYISLAATIVIENGKHLGNLLFYSIVKSIFLDWWSHCLFQYQIDFPLSLMHPDFPLHLSSAKDIYDCLFASRTEQYRMSSSTLILDEMDENWENVPQEEKQLFPGKSNARQICSFDRRCKCISGYCYNSLSCFPAMASIGMGITSPRNKLPSQSNELKVMYLLLDVHSLH